MSFIRKILMFVCVLFAMLIGFWQIISVALSGNVFENISSESLSRLPVLNNGRVMPLSSVASDVLKTLSGKSTIKYEGKKISAVEWFFLINSSPEQMEEVAVFVSDNKDFVKMLGLEGRYYSYKDFSKKLTSIYHTAQSNADTLYVQACRQAINKAMIYVIASQALTFKIDESSVKSLDNWYDTMRQAYAQLSLPENGDMDKTKLKEASDLLKSLKENLRYEEGYAGNVARLIYVDKFYTPSELLYDNKLSLNAKDILYTYAYLADAIRDKDVEKINICKGELIKLILKDVDSFRVKFEDFYNLLNPFYGALLLYIVSLLSFIVSLFFKSRGVLFRDFALVFMCFGLSLHCFGIMARMYIQLRPPVTNLYSSIVFTGALSAIIGIWGLRKNNWLIVVSGIIVGLCSLIVAINLPHSGDTMGMMRAVLNSNFWLSVHVMTIMAGYSGVLLGGISAGLSLMRNLFKTGEEFGRNIRIASDNVYKILSFALLFAFAGTMLGGIWADMSWGRFWGWDPKENGALMVVLWVAATMHIRMMRVFSDRIFLAMAVLGNVIVGWAWFGVNLMGVGLHSYGFFDGGVVWLSVFVISQFMIASLALLKKQKR